MYFSVATRNICFMHVYAVYVQAAVAQTLAAAVFPLDD